MLERQTCGTRYSEELAWNLLEVALSRISRLEDHLVTLQAEIERQRLGWAADAAELSHLRGDQ